MKVFLLPLLAIFSLLTNEHSFHAEPKQFLSTTAFSPQPAATTTTISATADSYTRNGTYASDNYGTVSTFVVKTTTSSGSARAAYLKFSLASVSGTVSSAVLRIYGRCTETGIVAKLGAYGISDDSWTETGITWNNAPAASTTSITTLDIDDQNKWRDIDITSYVQEQLSGDKTVSLLLKSPTNLNRYLEFYSKEKSSSSNRPQLVITTTTETSNQPPVLAAIGNKSVTVGETLSFTASASDADGGQTLTYSLVNAPSGASINSTTGAFSWTPTTTGEYTFTVHVADNGTPVAVDDEQITVTVNASQAANQAPVLNAIGNQTVTIGQTLSFTATATDADASQTLSYALINAPGGAAIDASTGVFSWTPASTGTFTFTVQVSDNGTPVATDDEQITVTVNEAQATNQAPVLAAIGNKSVTVGETLSFTASASDADAGQTLTYSLVNAPNGAAINASTGAFSWTPSIAGEYTFTVSVTDNGTPAASDEEQITVTVSAAQPTNKAPVLAAIGNKTLVAGQTLSFTATATDENTDQTLAFSLVNAPSGATIDASTGAFSWTPATAGSFTFTVKVTDNGSVPLSDDEQITVTVTQANQAPVLASIGNKTAFVGQALTFTASASDADQGQTLTYSLVNAPSGASINSTTGAFSWTPTTTGTFTFTVNVSDNGSPALTDDEQITVTVQQPTTGTTTISATADSYTRNGTYASDNYGTVATFVVKTTTSSGSARAAYLKFSLASVSGTVSSAVLRIYGRCTETGIVAKLGAYGISDDSWTETGITWNNAPAASTTSITTLDIDDQNKWRDIDITSYVQEQLSGDKTVSLLLKSPTNLNRYLEFYSKEKSSSSNRPQLVITTTTETSNQPPVLAAIGNKSVTVGETLSFTASASDADGGQTLTYSLVNAPSGASINSTTGAFSWTPTATGTYTFTVKVSDNGSPVATDDEQIIVTVSEAQATNHAPVLDAIGNKTVTLGQTLSFTATASDADAGQTLTYALVNAPNGAAINASTGAFSWIPASTGTFTFTVQVSDNGIPVATDDEQITVTVNAATNKPPATPVNPSPANGASASLTGTTLCATVSDPDNNSLRVRYYGRRKVTNEKFTVVLLPDPQYYVSVDPFVKGGTNETFKAQTQWIVNNRVAKNIPFVGGLGDCSDHGDTFEVEWKRVDTAIRTIENVSQTGLAEGIPYGLCVGNHDQSPKGDAKGATLLFNKYFGSVRFNGRSYYGGHNGTNNDNHYELFSASGIDFLVLCPEFDESTAFSAKGGALDWMESIVKQYPNRKVIVMSHYVLQLNASFSTQGKAIYNRLKVYPNFILMVGGHIVNFSTGSGEARRSDTLNGNIVQTITQDYQARVNGGNGLLRTYEFDPVNNNIAVKTYSPTTNTFETDANSQFSIKVNLATTPAEYALIGEATNVTSGSSACVSWPSLMDNTTYEWYAEVSDGQNTSTGPVWTFKTKMAGASAKTAMESNLTPQLEIQETAASGAFTLYPNPAQTGNVTLSLHKKMEGNVQLEIRDGNGRLQLQKTYKDPGSVIHLEHHLAAGTYMVVLKSAHGLEAQKLVVVN